MKILSVFAETPSRGWCPSCNVEESFKNLHHDLERMSFKI